MTHHVHLLVTPEREDSLPRATQSSGRDAIVRTINAADRRPGTQWEGRSIDPMHHFFELGRLTSAGG
jgi:putative transposase